MYPNPLLHTRSARHVLLSLMLAGPAAAQTVIPASFAHPAAQADTALPGFRIRTVQAETTNSLDTSLIRTEAQLAGLLINPATGEPFENIADPAPFGPDGFYQEVRVVDYDQNGASLSGLTFPGIPGTTGGTDSFAVEALTYLNLAPGSYTMVVRSDDGFRVTTAPDPRNQLQALTLGAYDAGRGAADSSFDFTISAAGVYGFRLVYNEGGVDASLSWYLGNPADPAARILVNDPDDPASIKAFQKLTVPSGIYADVASPAPGATGVPSKPSLTYRLVDGATALVAPASVQLFLDGVKVTPVVAKNAGKTTVNYTVPETLPNLSVHTVRLIYSDSAAPTPALTTAEYSFTITDYTDLILTGVPAVSENFDSWAEQTDAPPEYPSNRWTYHDWTVEQYSNSNGGWDLDVPGSDAYQGWVVLSKDRVAAIGNPPLENWDGERRLEVAEQFINGVKVPTLISGNFFYAESDQRGGSQVQYLFSPDFNLTGKTGLYLYFHSIYEQNQDSIGAVEYSINQGASWLPVLYMVDDEDLIRDENNNINGELTLTEPRADTADYIDPESGEFIGDTYGAFIGAAPSTWSTLGPYISGRVDDDPVESKRVEFHRIPLADNQAKVRFRFAQAGTGSWYFGIDNFAVYSVPEVLPVLTVTQAAGKVVLSWPASAVDFKLQSSTSLATAASWTDVTGAAVVGEKMTIQITPSAPRVFYRLYK